MFKKLSLKGALIGSCVDIVTTNIMGLLVGILAGIALARTNVPSDQFSHALIDKLQNDRVYYWSQFFFGSLCSALGGYISARVAQHDEILNGACASMFGVMILIYGVIARSPDNSSHLAYSLGYIVLEVALCATGGFLRYKERQKRPT